MLLDINDFGPFSSDVWGTVSDWTMVIVTSITAIFIYRTLKSQVDVAKNQHELLRIEGIKYRKIFEPEFTWEGGNTWANDKNTVSLSLKLKNNHAYSVEIRFQPNYIFHNENRDRDITEYRVGHVEPLIPPTEFIHEELTYDYYIKIFFKDVNGEPYLQELTGNLANPYISPPRYIGS